MTAHSTATATGYILVVDDHHDVRESLRDALAFVGYDVVTARNGREGLQVLQQTEVLPDLIVTDLVMAEMDGLQLLRSVRQHAPWRAVPFLLVSGHIALPDRGRVLEDVGDVVCLRKPFTLQALLAAVASALPPVTAG